MQIAQRLYQGVDIEGETTGLITYMRTDGTNISKEAVKEFRELIENDFGKDFLPNHPNNYDGKKAKNAQEAHEAIRPTNVSRPDSFMGFLSILSFFSCIIIWLIG